MADASHFPIVEYRIEPTRESDGEGHWVWIWHSKRSVDLRWVVTAMPYAGNATWITYGGGSGNGDVIDAEYTDFMRDWCRAKGI